MKKMNNKGFSLVELIIVIAIMAILVGVLAPQFIKYVEQSRESTDISSIDEVKKAVETFVADYNPGGDITVVANGTNISATGGTSTQFENKAADYGITATTTTLKSKYSTITWTYSADNFTWTPTYTAPTTTPPYYNYQTGEKI